MAKMIKVNFRNLETKEFLEGTSLLEISKYFSKYFNYPILIARVDNNLKSLSDTISKKCDVDFYDRSHGVGNSVYSRTLQLMLIKAVKNVLGSDADVAIEYSIDKGFYVEIANGEIDKPILKDIEEVNSIIDFSMIKTMSKDEAEKQELNANVLTSTDMMMYGAAKPEDPARVFQFLYLL